MGMAQKTGIPIWVALVSGDMEPNLRNSSKPAVRFGLRRLEKPMWATFAL